MRTPLVKLATVVACVLASGLASAPAAEAQSRVYATQIASPTASPALPVSRVAVRAVSAPATSPVAASSTRVIAQPTTRVVARPRATVAPIRVTAPWVSLRQLGVVSQTQTHPVPPAPAPAGPGQLGCEVTSDGWIGQGLMEVRDSGRVIASGGCGAPLEVPAGRYDVTLTFLDALDRPQQTVPVVVPEGGVARATASFATAILEVRITKDGAAAPGITSIVRDGREVGTVGSGVVARLSAGRYELNTRHRLETKTSVVDLASGQRRAVRAAF